MLSILEQPVEHISPGDVLREGMSVVQVSIHFGKETPWWRGRVETDKPIEVTLAPHRIVKCGEGPDGEPIWDRDRSHPVVLYYELGERVMVARGVPLTPAGGW